MKNYNNIIALSENSRGIWDLDPSKGCGSGMDATEGQRGCYGDCYAARTAKTYGFDFNTTILRHFKSLRHERQVINKINRIQAPFIRMGCSGDPSENWEHTFSIVRKIARCNKEIVIITKHWNVIPESDLQLLASYKICINTSISALDEPLQMSKCLQQYSRLKPYCKSVLRIVSCDFNKKNETGLQLSIIQDSLFKNEMVIDTFFRPTSKNKLVTDGVINTSKTNFLGNKTLASKVNRKTFSGKCSACIEQCGVFNENIRRKPVAHQLSLL